MSTYPPPGSGPSAGQRIDEAVERMQRELRQAIAYVNDSVVPEVRRESISTMRKLAENLHKLADRMETRPPEPKGPAEDPRP